MAAYRVFSMIQNQNGSPINGDEIRFVRDGFSFLALIFPIIWLLWHRLWLPFAGLLVFFACLLLLSEWIDPLLGLLLDLLVSIYLGFEANSLVARKLAHKGYKEVDVLWGANQHEAEIRFFTDRYKIPKTSEKKQDDRPLISGRFPPRSKATSGSIIGDWAGVTPKRPGQRS